MNELSLQLSVRLQDEGVPYELARRVSQAFTDEDLTVYDAMEDALELLASYYAGEDRVKRS